MFKTITIIITIIINTIIIICFIQVLMLTLLYNLLLFNYCVAVLILFIVLIGHISRVEEMSLIESQTDI